MIWFKIFLSITTVLIAFSLIFSTLRFTEIEVPSVEDWFGNSSTNSEEITKFSINVSDRVLLDLSRRLKRAVFVEPIDGSKFNYGFHPDYLKEVVEYWRTKYDWKKQEVLLNKFNHFKTQISGINVHFIHSKPKNPAKTVIPIMMIHGWPGSFFEYYKLIPLLTESINDVSFEVVVPSIPGYGFSDAPQQKGFDVLQTARIFVKLMKRLKHERFVTHGGDWGSVISKTMAVLYPDNIRGLHLTIALQPMISIDMVKLIIGGIFNSLFYNNFEIEHKIYPHSDRFKFMMRETGYSYIQSTKPNTVAAALMDSPVGLAAYIMEKFSTWTNQRNIQRNDGNLIEKFTLDELLTNVIIYWMSPNLVSSLGYYKESVLQLSILKMIEIPVSASVPSAVCNFPNEIIHSSQKMIKTGYKNLIHKYAKRGSLCCF